MHLQRLIYIAFITHTETHSSWTIQILFGKYIESIKFIDFDYNFSPTQLTSIMDLYHCAELLSSKIDYQTPAILQNLSSEVFCALFVENMQHFHKDGNSELQPKYLALLYQFSMSHNINISNPIIYRKSTFHVAGMWQGIQISFGNSKRLRCCDR